MSITELLAKVKFHKYQGLGNDFILIDCIESTMLFEAISQQHAMKLCNRNFGIGADGVIFILNKDYSEMGHTKDCDYMMRIYNSDGSEPQMCGNGIRCVAQFLYDTGRRNNLSADCQTYRILTKAGMIIPEVIKMGLVRVDMGEPTVRPNDAIPTTLSSTYEDGKVVDSELTVNLSNSEVAYPVTAVSMGNPHAVSLVGCLQYILLFNSCCM